MPTVSVYIAVMPAVSVAGPVIETVVGALGPTWQTALQVMVGVLPELPTMLVPTAVAWADAEVAATRIKARARV
jgi:hypothetical protein